MTSRIEFDGWSDAAWRELRDRQRGLCALTGEQLNETAIAHHVVPADHGGQRSAIADAFVADWKRNCVLVNEEIVLDSGRDSGPHLRAHGGSFRDGIVADHGAFRYSHGGSRTAHELWAASGERFVTAHIFPGPEQRQTHEPTR